MRVFGIGSAVVSEVYPAIPCNTRHGRQRSAGKDLARPSKTLEDFESLCESLSIEYIRSDSWALLVSSPFHLLYDKTSIVRCTVCFFESVYWGNASLARTPCCCFGTSCEADGSCEGLRV